jgi:predicted RNA binding protein YcfA (HicA-like mRNA interferase family)
MSQRQKLLAQLLAGQSDRTINFSAVCTLLVFLGFEQRIRGSHHLFAQSGIEEIVNIQPNTGNCLKAYQARQIRELLLKYQHQLKIDLI